MDSRAIFGMDIGFLLALIVPPLIYNPFPLLPNTPNLLIKNTPYMREIISWGHMYNEGVGGVQY